MAFDAAITHVIESLKQSGFGVLTDIDVKHTLKQKLNADFREYRILGACNPPFAYRALQAEDRVGLMLPCNVIVQAISEQEVEVAAIDPCASMQAIDNDELAAVAAEVREKLRGFIEQL